MHVASITATLLSKFITSVTGIYEVSVLGLCHLNTIFFMQTCHQLISCKDVSNHLFNLASGTKGEMIHNSFNLDIFRQSC